MSFHAEILSTSFMISWRMPAYVLLETRLYPLWTIKSAALTNFSRLIIQGSSSPDRNSTGISGFFGHHPLSEYASLNNSIKAEEQSAVRVKLQRGSCALVIRTFGSEHVHACGPS